MDDTVVIDITTGKVTDYVKFDAGNLCMITGGHNMGRVGMVGHRERHPGSFDIVHVKDAAGHSFATRSVHFLLVSPIPSTDYRLFAGSTTCSSSARVRRL